MLLERQRQQSLARRRLGHHAGRSPADEGRCRLDRLRRCAGKDDKQISDIRAFVNSGRCDVLIVSPNTSDALTPAVEEACKALPVITFDRGVNTSCPVTAVHSIGGYAYGIAGAKFVVDNMPKGGKLLVLRTAPGIDVFETRSDAALQVFKDAGITPIGTEFTGADNAKTKAVVSDYLAASARSMPSGSTSGRCRSPWRRPSRMPGSPIR